MHPLSHPRNAALVGIIFVVIWWTDRRERTDRDRDSH